MSGSKAKIRVLIVDDHCIFRRGLAGSIEAQRDMRVVAEAADACEAIALHRKHRPDVTLMDLRLPGPSGIETLGVICRETPNARIVVISLFDAAEDVYRAFEAGAMAYLTKFVSLEELAGAVRAVHAGERYILPEIAARLAERARQPQLTPREFEVLNGIIRGQSNKEIGAALQISEVTVKVHVSSIFRKLRVHDRTQAATAALGRGLVALPEVRSRG